jgi:curli production assembly/transport component CsgG
MKKYIKKYFRYIIISTALIIINGCSAAFQPVEPSLAKTGEETKLNKQLASLPLPKEKIVATVYKFRDQTGQYKNSETGGSWSTAVTQGATSILIKALEESNWFVVIEREGLSNLLNERKIIRSSRANYQGDLGEENTQLLPPLLYAGIILEGGIISYDSNILTGGAGLKYFGVGASNQYREDRITVYLRAISTQSGRVLLTVYTSKTILSQLIDVSFFRFVKFKKLLEAETGYSHNEPAEMCVKEAIEKAVQNLIIEGTLKNLWSLNDSTEINSQIFEEYIQEKESAYTNDVYNREYTQRHNFGIGTSFGVQLYSGDISNSIYKTSGDFNIKAVLDENLAITLTYLGGQFASRKFFTTTIDNIEANLDYRFLSYSKFSPILKIGFGLTQSRFVDKTKNVDNKISKWLPHFISGLGIEYLVTKNFGINLMIDNHYYFDDKLDGLKLGEYNDYYWGGRLGFMFYFSF